jgi:cytochrome c556
MMNFPNRTTFIFLILMVFGCVSANAQESPAAPNEFQLSPELMDLLRAEMQALLTGIQSLAMGIATADWKDVTEKSARIRASYILDQKLTPAQRQELDTSLPEHFKRLDSDFHLEAKKLEAAATAHDSQLASFHYYRLIETCTACHAIYAVSRFPGFKPSTESAHHH